MARLIWVLATLMLIGGCADTPKTMYLDPVPDRTGQPWPVWPKAGAVPRFVYAGELLGETNFRASPDAQQSSGRTLLALIAGLSLDQPLAPLVLQRPQGGTVGGDGRIYVSDVSRQAVFVFDPSGGELLVWEWAAKSERFRAPIGIVVLPDGEVLVADAELGRVVRLAPDGEPRGSFGDAELRRPTGMALDAESGRLFVADTWADQIKVFTPQGSLVGSFGGRAGEPGQLNAPTYLAVAKGKVYVTDTLNARVEVFDTAGRALSSIGQRGLYVGNLTRPKGVAVSPGGLVYVVESYYDHLLVFDDEGQFLLPIGGTGQDPGEFYLPAGVWTDDRDRVFVADMFNGRVSIFQFLGDGP
jgi:DNA-binding beta-propeller fold protein YncE